MIPAKKVAEYFLSLVDEEIGETMSNMKLQKLLYYAQGFYLAIYGKPLFPESIEAWTHGPVVPDIYREYKSYGASPIPAPDSLDYESYGNGVREVLDEVYSVYGQFSATGLRNLTHKEPTWTDTPQGETISQDAMRDYFRTQLTDA
mgnify:CR=1 FL=1